MLSWEWGGVPEVLQSTTICNGRKPHQNLEGFDVNCAMSISVKMQQTYVISNLISTKLYFEYSKFDHRKFKQYLENDKWIIIWIWIEFPPSHLIWIVCHLLKYNINSKIILFNIFLSVHYMAFLILYVTCYFPGTESIVTILPTNIQLLLLLWNSKNWDRHINFLVDIIAWGSLKIWRLTILIFSKL